MKPEIYYVAIGDSLTEGVGAWPGSGFVNRYGILAQQTVKKPVVFENAGRRGATARDVADLIAFHAEIRLKIAQADIITITAGGNDLIQAAKQYISDGEHRHFRHALEQFREHFSRMARMITQLKRGRNGKYIVRSVGLYNPFPKLHKGGLWVREFNRHIQSFQGTHFRSADVYGAFLGREKKLLSFDHVHPNAEGYRVIAEQIHRTGYFPLA